MSEEDFAQKVPLQLDLAGVLFVEGSRRIEVGTKHLTKLRAELDKHRARVASASHAKGNNQIDVWVDVLQGVGGLESVFGAVITEFAVASVLLVAAAEAYVNAVAEHVLTGSQCEHFEKLSPVGKWLFLPRLMKLRWRPDLDAGCLQQFAQLAGRRNRIVHPRTVRAASAVDIEQFLKRLGIDESLAKRDRQAVTDLVRELSLSWRGSYGPDWLTRGTRRGRPCYFMGSIEASGRLAKPNRRRGGNKS